MPEKIRVLYVDDESTLLDIGKQVLEQSGDFTVTTATSAPDAIRLLEQEKFDVIVSDYQMPEMDGIEFLVLVRTKFGQIPFILFTGKGREEVVIEALNAGADGYLQKGSELKSQFAELSHKIKSAASRKKADDALKRSEENYRHLIEHADEAIVVAQDGMLRLVNHRAVELTGYSAQELLSMSFLDFIHPDDRAMVMERYQKRMKGDESPSRYSFRLSPKDGSPRWVEISVAAIDWDERPATLNFLTDITERKQADDSLRKEQQFSKLMLDSLPGIFYLYTYPENRLIRWNKQHETLLGYTAEEIKGKLSTDLHLPEYKDAVLKAIDEVMEKGQSSVESTLLAKDGRQIPFFFTGVRFEAPGQLYFMGIGIDITERKRVEEALQRSEEKFRAIADYTVNWESWFGPDGKYIWVSPSVAQFTGYSDGEILAMPDFISTVIAKEDRPLFTERFREAIRGIRGENFEFRYLHRNGTKHWLNASWQPIFDMNGNSLGTRSSGQDITERKRAEEALRESKELLTEMTTQVPGAVYQFYVRTNGELGFYYVSERSEQILGLKPDLEGYFERFTALVIPEHREGFIKSIETSVKELSEWKYEGILQKPTGEKICFFGSSTPSLRENEIIFNGIVQDITERKKAEDTLALTARKLTLMNDVTYQYIQNKVTAVRGYAELSKDVKTKAERLSFIEKEEHILADIHHLIKNTREYQEIGLLLPQWIPVERSVRIAVSLVSPRQEISIETALHGLELYTDPLIEKIIANLIENAVIHGKTTRHITFSCKEMVDGLTLICEDDGVGISPEIKVHLFERSVGENIHFGLFFVRECLLLSGMTIAETGEPGKGARFEITVPKGAYRFTGTGG